MTNYVTATAASAVITLGQGMFAINQIAWSYAIGSSLPSEAAPGTLSIVDNGTTLFNISIPAFGVSSINFPENKMQTSGRGTTVITLTSGGTAVVGKLNVLTTPIG